MSTWRSLLRVALLLCAAVWMQGHAQAGPCGATPHATWKHALTFGIFQPDTLTRYPSTDEEPGWVKFIILNCDPTKVYFQDGFAYPFHFDFASARVAPFVGASRAAFDAATLHLAGQQAVLGAVLVPSQSSANVPEFGIQFVGLDAYPKERVRDLFNLVKSKITFDRAVTGFYMPTFEQSAAASADAAWFAEQGMQVATTGRWTSGDRVYSKGWALGTLKYVPATQVQQAYRSGQLTAADILLTDGVPAELPYVAGIVSLAPATPNSHVAILAATYRVPMMHASTPAMVARMQSLVNKRVLLRADENYGIGKVDVTDTTNLLTPQQLADVMSLKEEEPLAITPMQARGAYYLNVDALTPTDIKYVGGKAANYGYLRRAVPANTRPALGLTFDVWNAFMDQTLTTGRTLREEIALKLAPHTWPIANPAQMSADLLWVQDLIKNTAQTQFNPAMQAGIIAALQDPAFGFDQNTKIRFRSSTNVEDTANFTGAGLYESFSGCLADDLDADTVGPSICDPAEANERGVFRAIRRVFASFYYENAWATRRRLQVNEVQVGMAMLVHHSYPDPTELANGVVILDRKPNETNLTISTQEGATSVTNPEPGVVSEEVIGHVIGANIYVSLNRSSNLVQIGQTVMAWETDYRSVVSLCNAVANRIAQETGQATFSLDFEFKKTTFGNAIEMKQVRPFPRASTAPTITPYMMPLPVTWDVFQGESSDVYANHRMKSSLTIKPKGGWLTQQNLEAGIFESATFRWRDDCWDLIASGPLTIFPGYTHSYSNQTIKESWRYAGVSNPVRHTLSVPGIASLVGEDDIPVLLATDLGQQHGFGSGCFLEAVYDRPVPARSWTGQPITRTEEIVSLVNPTTLETLPIPVRREMGGDGIAVVSEFYWPKPPTGIVAGYTAPLSAWNFTTITGLTTLPITLRHSSAQTYRPGHHNFTEEFIFDPRYEPTLTAHQRRQLRDQNIGPIWCLWGSLLEDTLVTYPYDCQLAQFCVADLVGGAGTDVPDGAVDINDLLAFLVYFEAGDERADMDDGSGTGTLDEAVDINDLVHFLVRFEAGC